MPTLSDRQRVELAIPAYLLCALTAAPGVFVRPTRTRRRGLKQTSPLCAPTFKPPSSNPSVTSSERSSTPSFAGSSASGRV